MNLACFKCRNLNAFVQVSHRGDARPIEVTIHGIRPGAWDIADARPPGFYCANPDCKRPIEADPTALELEDQRIEYVAPSDFRADDAATAFMGLRSDATWSRLTIPGNPAAFASVPDALHPLIVEALARTGRSRLYSHQAAAISAALAGDQVVQATSAGSGKSLGLVLPVLDALLRGINRTAILVYPLRALANDQLNALASLSVAGPTESIRAMFELDLGGDSQPITIGRIDGSTLESDRKAIRKQARLLITTPDMIHASILRMAARRYQDGTDWGRLLHGLRYVVLDEIHTYQGVFGSNVAQVLRRLRRAAEWHGGSPRFLAASATIGNPVDLVERLTGTAPFTLIDVDGSPQRPREVLICNPPISVREAKGGRRRSLDEQPEPGDPSTDLDSEVGRIAPQTVALELVAAGALAREGSLPVRTICFERSRVQVAALAKRIQGRLESIGRRDLAPTVASYTATLLSDDREDVEGSLRDGSLLAVVSTNALELGIDVPDLSIAVLCGYPGQISSFRQRAGRVGRAGEGLVVLIVGEDPLQQHIAQRPEALVSLLEARAEDVIINPDAPAIVQRYGLAPGQADLGGIAVEDAAFFGQAAVDEFLASAVGAPTLIHDATAYWTVDLGESDPYPGLRQAAGGGSYTVFALSGRDREAIGVIDEGTAPRDAFVDAIWPGPKGRLYRITDVDQRTREIFAEGPLQVQYLTRGVPVDSTEVLDPIAERTAIDAGALGYSNLRITRWVHSYKKMPFAGGEQTVPLERRWPPVAFDTEGLHLHLDPEWGSGEFDRAGAVKAVEHLLLSLAPVVVACDPFDIDGNSDQNTLFLYDAFGAGIGITRAVFDRFDEVVSLAIDTVRACPCEKGCPGCIVLSRRPDGNDGLSKRGAELILAVIAESERRPPS